MLDPREAWADKAAYDRMAHELIGRFEKNFAAFEAGVGDEVGSSDPRRRLIPAFGLIEPDPTQNLPAEANPCRSCRTVQARRPGMYHPPPLFKEDRIDVLHDAIRHFGLGTLVTLTADGMIASHVPMLLEPDPAIWHPARTRRAAEPAGARGIAGCPGAGNIPGAGRLHDAVLVCDQAGDRQGRADLELRCDPRLWAGRVLPDDADRLRDIVTG